MIDYKVNSKYLANDNENVFLVIFKYGVTVTLHILHLLHIIISALFFKIVL